MKTIARLSAIASVLVVACWAGVARGDLAAAQAAGDHNADLRSFGLSLRVPAGWLRMSETSYGQLALFARAEGTKLLGSAEVLVLPNTKGKAVAEVAATVAGQLRGKVSEKPIDGAAPANAVEITVGAIGSFPAARAVVFPVHDEFVVLDVATTTPDAAAAAFKAILGTVAISPREPAADDLSLRRRGVGLFESAVLLSLPEPFRPNTVKDPAHDLFFGARDWASGRDEASVLVHLTPNPNRGPLGQIAKTSGAIFADRMKLPQPVVFTKTNDNPETYLSAPFGEGDKGTERAAYVRLDDDRFATIAFHVSAKAPPATRDRYLAMAVKVAESARVSTEYQEGRRAVTGNVPIGGNPKPSAGNPQSPGAQQPPVAQQPPATLPPAAAGNRPQPDARSRRPRSSPGADVAGEVLAVRTPMVGAMGGGPFASPDPQGRPVIGFRYAFGHWNNRQCLRMIEPVYDRGADAAPSAQTLRRFGLQPKDFLTAFARDGYAVGGLTVDADVDDVTAVRVHFYALKDGRLDLKQTYVTPWLGVPCKVKQQQIGCDGRTAVGSFGRQGLNVAAVGLLLDGGARKTAQLGGNGGQPIVRLAADAGPVVGFRYTTGNWGGRKVLRTFDPVYADPNADDGAIVSDEPSQTIRARDGYAVGGVLVDADDVNAVAAKVTFVRVRNGAVVPGDAYETAWVGGEPSGLHQAKLAGKAGDVVVGTCGRKGLNLDALGLLVAPAADAAGGARGPANPPTPGAK